MTDAVHFAMHGGIQHTGTHRPETLYKCCQFMTAVACANTRATTGLPTYGMCRSTTVGHIPVARRVTSCAIYYYARLISR